MEHGLLAGVTDGRVESPLPEGVCVCVFRGEASSLPLPSKVHPVRTFLWGCLLGRSR